jgi:hypothetical protein
MNLYIPIFMTFILLDTLLLSDTNFSGNSILDKSVETPETIIESWKSTRFNGEELSFVSSTGGKFNTVWEQMKCENKRVDRVILDDNLSEYVYKYKIILDTLLDGDETFVDFMNKSLLYSLLGKKSPVYVSQSPLQLSGEYTQLEYIKEIEGTPVVLMPIDPENWRLSNSLDTISNTYRYYMVSEYIYQKYIPLCKFAEEYAVWCLPEKYGEYKNKIEKLKEEFDAISFISYGYDGPFAENDEEGAEAYKYINGIHSTNLAFLPGIWARFDELKSINNKTVCECINKDGLYLLGKKLIDHSSRGNYIKLHATYDGNDKEGKYNDDDEYANATLILGLYKNGVFEEKCRYLFNVEEGDYDYLIRSSTDYYWYLGYINAVKIESSEHFRNIKITILEGD